jgi:hypothetical protein
MMTTTQDAAGRIDLTLNGAPITVGQRTLHPVAQLRGWRGHGGDGANRGGGAFVWLRPVAVHVTEAGKPDYTVSIGDPTAQPLRMLGGIALAIALFFGVIALLGQWRSAR